MRAAAGGRGRNGARLIARRVGEISALGIGPAIVRAGGRPRRRGSTDPYAWGHDGVAVHVDIDMTASTTPGRYGPSTATTPAAAAAPLGESLGRQPHCNEENGRNGGNGSI